MGNAALLITLLLALSSPQSTADAFRTGNGFQRYCGTSVELSFACTVYAQGVYRGNEPYDKLVCKPEGVDTGQIYEVGLDYIRKNPASAHLSPSALLVLAWRQAFPCE